MFSKEIDKVYRVLEDYKQRHRYDNSQRKILAEILINLYQEILPKWEMDHFGFYEIDELRLREEQQWEEELSTHEGIDRIMFLLRSQDENIKRYSNIIHRDWEGFV